MRMRVSLTLINACKMITHTCARMCHAFIRMPHIDANVTVTAHPPDTTIIHTLTTSTGEERGQSHTWVELGRNVICDTNAEEEYMGTSPGKVSSLKECKQSCQDASECQSITFFKTRKWCSHFSTACTHVTPRGMTTTLRLVTT